MFPDLRYPWLIVELITLRCKKLKQNELRLPSAKIWWFQVVRGPKPSLKTPWDTWGHNPPSLMRGRRRSGSKTSVAVSKSIGSWKKVEQIHRKWYKMEIKNRFLWEIHIISKNLVYVCTLRCQVRACPPKKTVSSHLGWYPPLKNAVNFVQGLITKQLENYGRLTSRLGFHCSRIDFLTVFLMPTRHDSKWVS